MKKTTSRCCTSTDNRECEMSENKTISVSFRVEPSLDAKLRKVATQHNTTRATVVRALISECDKIYPILLMHIGGKINETNPPDWHHRK